MKPQAAPERGDLVEINWVDISEGPGGPDEAILARRVTVGYWWGKTTLSGVDATVTTSTQDKDITGINGYIAYPTACITNLRVIRRARKIVKKKVQ